MLISPIQNWEIPTFKNLMGDIYIVKLDVVFFSWYESKCGHEVSGWRKLQKGPGKKGRPMKLELPKNKKSNEDKKKLQLVQ